MEIANMMSGGLISLKRGVILPDTSYSLCAINSQYGGLGAIKALKVTVLVAHRLLDQLTHRSEG